MSVSAAHSSAFFREANKFGEVFTVRDEGGIPAPMTSAGVRAMPFWSRESRAQRVIDNVPAYEGFSPMRVSLAEFRDKWIPGLSDDGLLIGVN